MNKRYNFAMKPTILERMRQRAILPTPHERKLQAIELIFAHMPPAILMSINLDVRPAHNGSPRYIPIKLLRPRPSERGH